MGKQYLVCGGGAVGLSIVSCLIKAGVQPSVITRSDDTVCALRHAGLTLTGKLGQYTAPPTTFAVYTTVQDVPEVTQDYILFCTKAYDVISAAQMVAAQPTLVNARTKIVLFQNGWGIADALLPLFSRDQIFNSRFAQIESGFEHCDTLSV
jgi:ketopantoate reductase